MSRPRAAEHLFGYLNDTLSEPERAAVERALADPEGAALREELAELRELRDALAETGPEEPAWKPTGIHEVLRQIDLYEREQRARAEARPLARLARWLDVNLASLWKEATGVGRLALATQLALILALGAVALREPGGVAEPTLPPEPSGEAYGTATGSEPASERARTPLLVAFAPDAREADIRKLLRELRAEIVGGPSNQDVYEVAPVDTESDPVPLLEDLASALEQSPGLVRYVGRPQP